MIKEKENWMINGDIQEKEDSQFEEVST